MWKGRVEEGAESFDSLVGQVAKAPMVGEDFYLVKNKGSDLYYQSLIKKGVPSEKIFSALADAYKNLTGDRGDVLYVCPGDHVQIASLTWAKNQTRIVGLGGPNQRHQPSTLTAGGARLTCKTAAIGNILNITGKYVQMWDIGTFNSAADTGNLTDIVVAGRNFYAKRCAFRGGNDATQVGNALAGIPLTISTDAYGFNFEECEIGSAGNTTRTTGPGFVRFAAGAGGAGKFKDCDFSMRSETNGAGVSGFTVEEAALDRLLQFIGCSFYNFSVNWGALPDYLFNVSQTTTFDIVLRKGCSMIGFDIVSNNAHVKTSEAQPSSAGVEAVSVATS